MGPQGPKQGQSWVDYGQVYLATLVHTIFWPILVFFIDFSLIKWCREKIILINSLFKPNFQSFRRPCIP